MGEYKPPFHMTDSITNLVAAICEQVGRITVLSHGNLNPHLRKQNKNNSFVTGNRAKLAFIRAGDGYS